jgi:hypothetical protein
MSADWMVKAIEREAMSRATQQLWADPEAIVRVFGLTAPQIHALMRRFRKDTGCDPIEMSANAILSAARRS